VRKYPGGISRKDEQSIWEEVVLMEGAGQVRKGVGVRGEK
jgi:hypothetical protein